MKDIESMALIWDLKVVSYKIGIDEILFHYRQIVTA